MRRFIASLLNGVNFHPMMKRCHPWQLFDCSMVEVTDLNCGNVRMWALGASSWTLLDNYNTQYYKHTLVAFHHETHTVYRLHHHMTSNRRSQSRCMKCVVRKIWRSQYVHTLCDFIIIIRYLSICMLFVFILNNRTPQSNTDIWLYTWCVWQWLKLGMLMVWRQPESGILGGHGTAMMCSEPHDLHHTHTLQSKTLTHECMCNIPLGVCMWHWPQQ